MRLILEVKSGLFAGRKIWLGPSQSQTVGRTAEAGFVVSGDAHLSGVHFAVECGQRECRLRDLGSSNGTFLNEERVQAAPIYEGDVIRAGGTTFAVSVKGGSPQPARRAAARAAAGQAAMQGARQPAAASPPAAYRKYACRSGLSLLRGVTCRFDVAEICARLAGMAPLYMVASAGAIAMIPQSESHVAVPVFDPIPKETGADESPVIMGPCAGKDWFPFAAGAWGQDSLLLLCDRRPLTEVASQLRRFACEMLASPATRRLATFRPAAMSEFLANGEPQSVAALAGGMLGILLEVHQGDRWAWFGGEELVACLDEAGFCEAPAWGRS
jgi:hypothetical protein